MAFFLTKLEEWGLSKYISSFQENEIDDATFNVLDEHAELVKELIPLVGPRIKFIERLKDSKKSKAKEPSHEEPSPKKAKTADRDKPKLGEVTVEDHDEFDSDKSGDDDMYAPLEKQSKMNNGAKLEIANYAEGSNKTKSNINVDHLKYVKKGSTVKNMFDIRGILLKHFEGEKLVEEMSEGLLSVQTRKKVVATLVSYLVENYSKYPKAHIKLAMAKAIVQQFPALDNEDGDGYEAWFTQADKTHNQHDANGYIENRLRNIRRRDPSSQGHKPQATKSKLISSIPVIKIDEEDDDDPDTQSQVAMTLWLKNNKVPVDQVKKFMVKTTATRTSYIREHSLEEIMSEYPRLIDVDGMIEQDFRTLFPEAVDKMFMKWPEIASKILVFAKQQVDWQSVLKIESPEEEEEKLTCAIQLFPAGTRGDGRKSRKQKATVAEALQSYVQCVPIGTNLPEFMVSLSFTQPLVVLLGDRMRPEQQFVIFERRALEARSVLQAVDLCFKIFYIFNLNYPWQSNNVWDFLQKIVYGLGEGKGRLNSTPSVLALKNFILSSNKEM